MKHPLHEYLWFCAIALVLAGFANGAAARWGADYFPNVPLTTHDGKTVRFFDDLLKDKVVAVNFIYTHCPDTCPLETAQLVKVQQIMGDRVGKDVHFYSITIDPERDTPEVLAEYRERFGAKWTFLTGRNEDIIALRKRLGLYIEEIQDGSNNHNVNMIIGNQATGRWMKRSPFENPYVLADQLGNWLTGWKSPQRMRDYAQAPKLRDLPRGEQIFRTRCQTCHTVTGNEPAGALGPDLLGVTRRRDPQWLLDWLRAPDQMLEQQDPIAMALYEQYNQLAMPNMRLHKEEALALLDYLEDETRRIRGEPEPEADQTPVVATFEVSADEPRGDVVAIMNAWVREAHTRAKVNAGYMTLVNVGAEDVTLVKVESEAFASVEVHEMATVDGLMTMREVTDLVIPAKGQVRFEPGGMHLMLMGPREHLATGQQVDMTLTFASGDQQTVSVKVASR
jgi:copper(I)-binding protein/cytochrome oxidase Cu insertion factor (SCO1/SenC/PrrC family)